MLPTSNFNSVLSFGETLHIRSTLPQPRFEVRRGTTAEKFLREGLGRQPVTLSEYIDELYDALSASPLDAIIDDLPIAIHFANASPGLSYRGPYANTEGEYAIIVAKDNSALKKQINATLSVLRPDMETLRNELADEE